MLPGRGIRSQAERAVSHCPYSKAFLPDSQFESIFFQFKTISFCPIATCSYKKLLPSFPVGKPLLLQATFRSSAVPLNVIWHCFTAAKCWAPSELHRNGLVPHLVIGSAQGSYRAVSLQAPGCSQRMQTATSSAGA